MRHPSSLPALSVLAGVIGGSLVPSLGNWVVVFALFVAWTGVGIGLGTRSRAVVSTGLAIGFAAFGLWAGARDARRAEAPPLKRVFDRRSAQGRDGTPLIVVGRLRRDAAETPYGATLSIAVEHVIEAGHPSPGREPPPPARDSGAGLLRPRVFLDT